MCRNIRPLFNFDPPATDDEIREASVQFVRKIIGSHTVSRANEIPIDRAVEAICLDTKTLLEALTTHAAPKNREIERAKRKARSDARFGRNV